MHGLIFDLSEYYWQNQPGWYPKRPSILLDLVCSSKKYRLWSSISQNTAANNTPATFTYPQCRDVLQTSANRPPRKQPTCQSLHLPLGPQYCVLRSNTHLYSAGAFLCLLLYQQAPCFLLPNTAYNSSHPKKAVPKATKSSVPRKNSSNNNRRPRMCIGLWLFFSLFFPFFYFFTLPHVLCFALQMARAVSKHIFQCKSRRFSHFFH